MYLLLSSSIFLYEANYQLRMIQFTDILAVSESNSDKAKAVMSIAELNFEEYLVFSISENVNQSVSLSPRIPIWYWSKALTQEI